MRIELSNIGIIDSASIELNGLTVIAGNNDTGKSTVGKVAYCFTKAFENFEEEYKKERNNSIERKFRIIYTLVRRQVSFIEKPALRKFFENIGFYNIESKDIPNLISEGLRIIEEEDMKKELKDDIIKLFREIEDILRREITNESMITENLKMILSSEFKNQISNFIEPNSKIDIYEGENNIISVRMLDGKFEGITINDKIFPFESSTFIETPLILAYKDSFEFGDEAHHIDDLLKKLQSSAVYKEKLESNISKIINGEFSFDEDEDYFQFKRKIGSSFINLRTNNVASGIKNFGILQLLEKSGEFNKNTLLIIDEPEVHLHPDWQVEYAKILVSIIKRGVKVLLTSHSPYLIEALNKYSRESKIESGTKFYLSEKNNNGKAIISDKTNNKDEIFSKLSKPFERLIFGDEYAQ